MENREQSRNHLTDLTSRGRVFASGPSGARGWWAMADRILGIETSCDETAAAVVERTGDGIGKILSNIVL